VGSGKTTLIRNLIRSQLKGSVIAKVFNTRVDSLQLLVQINSDFGLETEGRDKASLLRDLNDFLIVQYGKRKQSVLIIDEAQNLTAGMLEEVRMLSNLETDRDKLLQIILVGQPELRDTLAQPRLLQLRQRIQISCHLQPLSKDEVREYILFRMEKAGKRNAVTWQDDAIKAIASYSRGIPRLINILCDYVMVDAFSTQTKTIEGKVVHELATDLSFEAQYWSSKPLARPEPNQSSQSAPATREAAAGRTLRPWLPERALQGHERPGRHEQAIGSAGISARLGPCRPAGPEGALGHAGGHDGEEGQGLVGVPSAAPDRAHTEGAP